MCVYDAHKNVYICCDFIHYFWLEVFLFLANQPLYMLSHKHAYNLSITWKYTLFEWLIVLDKVMFFDLCDVLWTGHVIKVEFNYE